MNLLCLLGLHKYHLLELTTTVQIQEDIKAKLENRWPCDVASCGYPFLATKVCLRCEKIYDSITPYKRKAKIQIRDIERKIERITRNYR